MTLIKWKKYYTVGTVENFQDEKKIALESSEDRTQQKQKKTRSSKEHVIVHLAFNLTANFFIKNQPIFFYTW